MDSSASYTLPAGWWSCDACDRAPMLIKSKAAHEASKKHTNRVQASQSGFASNGKWKVCTICKKAVERRLQHIHLTPAQPVAADTKAGERPNLARSENPVKSKGNAKGKGNGKGAGGASGASGRGSGGGQKGRNGGKKTRYGGGGGGGGGSWGRAYDYGGDEDVGLLHDIDTAFGLLPGGGAYKESGSRLDGDLGFY
ncbi:hypothetical protein CYLTODRAFT_425371 [Cylindrobasidium torrendii FP15055 ss-10]|uniref:U1-type domain-containing protein n=1 Tax=Cylindrobasidium torrendii FP15055 ss-10 TaxID=1314674 RepID=A0A0D7B254_9AGAR|nr:hypothetical protein CYLTODRAFT_425371 [Cylindrobasidium torrendii FP15055 ss-10]